jgi:hypothetical protein
VAKGFFVGGVVAAAIAMSCLPRSSRLRADEAEAERYRLDVQVVATAGATRVEWSLAGFLDRQYSRTFTDGSTAIGLRFAETAERWNGVAHPAGIDGAILELRSFRDGRILDVGPLGSWVGTRGHVEILDPLWMVLSPAIPRGGGMAKVSFPTRLLHGPSTRAAWELQWREAAPGWVGAGQFSAGAEPGPLLTGTATLSIEFAADQVRSARAVVERQVRAAWAAGEATEEQSLRATLVRAGSVPGFLAPRTGVLGTRVDDAEPTRRLDGSPLRDVPVDSGTLRPYVLVAVPPEPAPPAGPPPATIAADPP